MKQYLSLLLAAMLMTACSNDNEPGIIEYGTISLALSADKEVSVTTRADAATPTELANYLITIKQGAETKLEPTKYSDKFGEGSTMTYETGTGYTLTAESCTEALAESANDNWGTARFADTSDAFSITSGNATPVALVCSMQNARVSVNYNETFKSVFTDYTVEVHETSASSRTLTFQSDATTSGPYAYFNIDANPQLTYVIKGKFNGSEVRELKTGTCILAAKQWSKLNISADSNGQISLSITIDTAVTEIDEEINVNPYA